MANEHSSLFAAIKYFIVMILSCYNVSLHFSSPPVLVLTLQLGIQNKNQKKDHHDLTSLTDQKVLFFSARANLFKILTNGKTIQWTAFNRNKMVSMKTKYQQVNPKQEVGIGSGSKSGQRIGENRKRRHGSHETWGSVAWANKWRPKKKGLHRHLN